MVDASGMIKFLKKDVWRIRGKDLSRPKGFFLRMVRILLLSLRGVTEDNCQLRASAMTLYSLLSVVPLVAMIFVLAKGLGFERALERQLLEKLEGQAEVVTWIIKFAHSLLESAKGGVLAGIGVVVLLLSVIMLLSNMENSLNRIWGIKTPRSLVRKISDYLSLMLICPLMIFLASSMTVLITSQIKTIVTKIPVFGVVSPGILFLLKFLPYWILWVLFAFLYIFIPNTKVKFWSGVLAGVIAGTIYQIFQWGYIHFQIGVAKYNAIYGSFAALPLFLIWLQTSWLILLFGAEISFAHQNVDTCEFEPDCMEMSPFFKRLLSLRITALLVRDFSEGGKPWSASGIARELEIPIRCVRQALEDLVGSGILSEVMSREGEMIAYQPARSVDTLTLKSVMEMLDKHGIADIPVARSRELAKISESIEAFWDLMEKSPANLKLKEI